MGAFRISFYSVNEVHFFENLSMNLKALGGEEWDNGFSPCFLDYIDHAYIRLSMWRF